MILFFVKYAIREESVRAHFANFFKESRYIHYCIPDPRECGEKLGDWSGQVNMTERHIKTSEERIIDHIKKGQNRNFEDHKLERLEQMLVAKSLEDKVPTSVSHRIQGKEITINENQKAFETKIDENHEALQKCMKDLEEKMNETVSKAVKEMEDKMNEKMSQVDEKMSVVD